MRDCRSKTLLIDSNKEIVWGGKFAFLIKCLFMWSYLIYVQKVRFIYNSDQANKSAGDLMIDPSCLLNTSLFCLCESKLNICETLWLWTEQDVPGRYGPDSSSNSSKKKKTINSVIIGCCRTWSPPQNITIQTPVMRSDPLMCTQDMKRAADCLKTINNWLLKPSSPATGTAFAIKVSGVTLSFVWIRASTYTEKKAHIDVCRKCGHLPPTSQMFPWEFDQQH